MTLTKITVHYPGILICLMLIVFLSVSKIYGQINPGKPKQNLVVGGGGDGGDGGDGGGGDPPPSLPPCRTLQAPVIQSTPVTPQGSTGSITLNWSNVGVGCEVFYRQSGAANYISGCSGGVSCTLSSLPSGFFYNVYVSASRDCQTPGNGPSTDTKISNVVTPGILIGPPGNLSTSSVTPTSFTANWAASNGAAPVVYQLEVNTNSAFNGTVILSSNENTNSKNVSGLMPGTTYYFRLRANNVTGTSSVSQVGSVTTLPPPIPPAPTAPAATSVTANSFTANWQKTGFVDHSYVDVSINSGFTSFVFQNLDAGTSSSLNIAGLSSATTYYFRVRASNRTGTSPNSTTGTQVTAPGAPNPCGDNIGNF
jgi:hypothetical protein